MTDWLTFHGNNARTGAASETTLTRSNVGKLHVVWSKKLGASGSNGSSPAISAGVLYIGDGAGVVSAIRLSDQATLWQRSVAGPVSSSPAVVGSNVIIGDYAGKIWAFDAGTGLTQWSFLTPSRIQSAILGVGTLVVAGSGDGSLYGLDVTGKFLWKTPTVYAPLRTGQATDGTLLFYGGDDSKVHAVGFDGQARWASAKLPGRARGTPVVVGGVVYAGNDDGHVRAWDAATGALRWTSPVLGTNTPTKANVCPAVSPDGTRLYTMTNEGVDGGTGTSAPAGHALALDATTGVIVWRVQMPDMSAYSPTVWGGMVLVSGYGKGLTKVLDAVTGAKLWTSGYSPNPFDGAFIGAAAVVDGRIYQLSVGGTLYALGV